MPDYAGPLQRLVPLGTLWLVVVCPIFGFLLQVVVVRRLAQGAKNLEQARRALVAARNAGLFCIALAIAATLAHVVVLAYAPPGTNALFQPLARGARFGQLDAQVDLLFDPLSAAFSVLACLVTVAAAVLVSARPSTGDGWRSWAWLQLSLSGALMTFVADGFVGTAVGWAVAGAAGVWLAGWNGIWPSVVAAMRTAVAIGAMLVGATLLFWGLGGAWDGDEYSADAQPRFASVRVGAHPPRDPSHDADSEPSSVPSRSARRPDERAADAPATSPLTLTGVPGALVFVDDTRAPPLRSPFVGARVSAGSHTLRIHTGDGASDQVLQHVVLEEGADETTLVPLGPTLTFRGISDQLAVRDRDGNLSLRTALAARSGPGGVAVVAASLLAMLIAAGLMSGTPPTGGGPLALSAVAQGATIVTLGPFLIARVALLFPLAPSTWVAVESIGAAILLVAGWRAPTSSGIQRWLAFVGVAPAALGILALGASGVTAATSVIVLAGMATAAFYIGAAALVMSTNASAPALARGPIEDFFLIRAPVRLGALIAGMDRWVVGAVVAAVAGATRAAAWSAAAFDREFVGAPGEAAASGVVRFERAVEPTFGVRPSRVAWGVIGVVAVSVFLHAVWPGR
jgi:hypothetical protein